MAQVFREDGELVPVTVVKAGPCTVTQIRTRDLDGYDAIQIGFGEKRRDRLTKADYGQAKATRGDDAPGYQSFVEVRVDNPGEY
ncbi:MAG: 50S ribosomal protein L3, partial [Dehalococcoidia bacterium]